MELLEAMERFKLTENKADKRNQPEINTFQKKPI